MSNYNYKGDLKGFPDEIVEWMLDQQEAQGNRRDVRVFEEDRNAHRSDGGITWCEVQFPFVTSENPGELCSLIIEQRCFDLFLYPKNENETTQTPEPAHADALLSAMKGGDK